MHRACIEVLLLADAIACTAGSPAAFASERGFDRNPFVDGLTTQRHTSCVHQPPVFLGMHSLSPSELEIVAPAARPGVLSLDTAKYREHVADLDLSEAEMTELLQILWSIMSAFVDLGFGVDSTQRVLPTPDATSSEAITDAGEQYAVE